MDSQNVLITGASSGIGASIASYLHSRGHNVWGTSRTPTTSTSGYPMIELDVDDDDSARAAVRSFIDENGHIDLLVNNAGFGLAGPAEDTSIELAKQQFETNFFGVVRMTQAVLPHMRNGDGGKIFNIGSIGGLIGLPFHAFYSASKFALEGYVESLRLELRPWNIAVVNIDPGDYDTNFNTNIRMVENPSAIYRKNLDAMLAVVEEDEDNGGDPTDVAKLVEKLMNKPDGHHVRYLVGKAPQKLAVYLKRSTSSRFFERIIARSYQL